MPNRKVPQGSTGYLEPPGLPLFLAALRWQESGSPAGNYREPNGQGAYQIIQSNWPAWARDYADYNTLGDANASDAPASVQDQVAAIAVSQIYYGPAKRKWRLVARWWNGGTVGIVPNRALGPGATNDTYATQLLHKRLSLTREHYQPSFDPSGAVSITSPDLGALAAKDYPAGTGCLHPVKINIKFAPDLSFCFDKPLALVSMGAGGVLMLAGTAIVLVAIARDTPAGRAAKGALSVVAPAGLAAKAVTGKAAGAAAAQRPAARRARTAAAQATEAAERDREERLAARDRAAIARRLNRPGVSRTAAELDPARRPAHRASTRPRRTPYAPTGRPYDASDPAPF